MDLFEKCAKFTVASEAMAAGYYPYFIPFDGSEGTEVTYQGRRLIMAGSNNYLGLTTDPRVKQAAIDATARYGTSCTGSRLLNGTLRLHEELERELADFVGKETALVFTTGFSVNLGVIGSLVGRDDVAIVDRECHASIMEGCACCLGGRKRFLHNDMEDLERTLKRCPPKTRKLVVVDGVYSMGGDIAPLPRVVELCRKYRARLMVDDAHALGVLGEGRGTPAHFRLTDQVDLLMGTFSKALASIGGFIAGDAKLIHYLKHFARPFIFSASCPPSAAAAALAALRIVRKEPEHCRRVLEIGHQMALALGGMGFDVGQTETPIVPIRIGDQTKTALVWKALFDAGIFVNAIVPPAVPPKTECLRTSYMATHTGEQLSRILETLQKVGRQMGLI